MLWSILIAAIPERYHSAQELLHSLLEAQSVARMSDVELLYLMDTKRRSVGAKRNALLGMAQGEYVSFVDDDDLVASDYVQKIYRKVAEVRRKDSKHYHRADVICFRQRATLQVTGAPQVVHECEYSLEYYDRPPEKRRMLEKTDAENVLRWTGPPAHTMVWRRALVSRVRFSEKNFGEDVDWVDLACQAAKFEVQIPGEPLYFYRFSDRGTATR